MNDSGIIKIKIIKSHKPRTSLWKWMYYNLTLIYTAQSVIYVMMRSVL
jgi:hypothetical protein